MPATKIRTELFPKATTTRAQVEAVRNFRIENGAIRSTIDDESDPENYVLITERKIVGPSDS